MMTRLRTNLTTLQARVRPLYVEGGWYAVVPLSRERSEEEWVLSLLDEHNVLVQPGYFYDFPREAYAVVSLICEPRISAEVLGCLPQSHQISWCSSEIRGSMRPQGHGLRSIRPRKPVPSRSTG